MAFQYAMAFSLAILLGICSKPFRKHPISAVFHTDK